MKSTFFLISPLLILITSIINYSIEGLPIINGDYYYWVPFFTLILFFFVLKNKIEVFKINIYDCIIICLSLFGLIHFSVFSKATIYNTTIWNYISYPALYLFLRNSYHTAEITKKGLRILLYFCLSLSIINVFWMFLQWNRWVSSPNEFFQTTGLFFSPNQLGICLTLGILATFLQWKETSTLQHKIILSFAILSLSIGLIITQSRGAILSLCFATGYYVYHSKKEFQTFYNWKTFLGIGSIFVSCFYFVFILSQNKTESNSGRYFTTQQVIWQITKKPLGYGVNSFSLEYNKAKAAYFENNPNWNEMKNAGYVYNANNDLLELTFEQGIIWIIIFIFFTMLLFKKKETSDEIKKARTLLLGLIIFSLTNNLLLLPVFSIVACICTVVIINSSDTKSIYELNNRKSYNLLAIGMTLFFAFIQISRINAERNLFRLYKDKIYLKGENQLQGYLSKISNKGEEIFMGGIILVKNGYKEKGINYMQTGFELSGKPTLGRILANGLQKQKNNTQAEIIYTYNKNVEPYRYQARMDLFNLFIATNQSEKAKKMAQEIVHLPIKIPSDSIKNFKRKAKLYLNELGRKQKNK